MESFGGSAVWHEAHGPVPPATEEPDWPAYVAALQSYGVQFIAPPPDPSVRAGSLEVGNR